MAFIVEPGDAAFKTKLDKASREKAHEELNEVEKDRLGAVQSFRNLVLQERWLRTPTEFSFLLRFLRARKFSQLLAKETLENYWTVRTKYPEWFGDLDPADKTLQEIMRTCFYYSPLKCDKWGRRIVIEQIGNLDVDFMMKAFGIDSVFRTIILIAEWINADENVQVNGVCGFVDCTEMSIKHHLHLWNLENMKKMSQYFDKALPARMKGFHMYNEPPFFDAIWAMFSPLMREKTKSRMFLHGKSMANVYETVDMAILPAVYLPDDYTGPNAGTAEQIVEDMIADMMKPEFRNYIMDLSSKKYGVDLERKKQSIPTVASFRKLNTD